MANNMNSKQTETTTPNLIITQDALAHLGDGRLAYVKAIRSEDVASMFPQAPQIAPGEDRDAYNRFRIDLLLCLNPRDPLEMEPGPQIVKWQGRVHGKGASPGS